MRRALVVVMVGLVVATTAPSIAYAGFWGSVWGGVKKASSAPFRAGGWLIGQGAKSAIDPTLDGTFRRLRETTDHVAARFEDVMERQVDNMTNSLDQMAERRIDQIDKVLEVRLDQVDVMLDDKLAQMTQLADHVLDRQASILDANVTRIELMMQDNVSRLDQLSTDALNRIDEIQSNAFDRVDAALQDQVPLAAGRVARQFVIASTIIVFMVVLVGFGGVRLLKGLPSLARERRLSREALWRQLRGNLQASSRSMVHVGVPMLVIAACIHAAYWSYYATANAARVSRLEAAAVVFEAAGDFRSAISFRKRAFALDASPERQYWVNRDDLLARFSQSHGRTDIVELARRLGHVADRAPDMSAGDAELQAMRTYIASRHLINGGDDSEFQFAYASLGFTPDAPGLASAELIGQSISDYRKRHLEKTGIDRPSLGYLVLASEIRIILDDTTQSLVKRVANAQKVADDLKTHYPRYAAGFLMSAQLRAMHLDVEAWAPSSRQMAESTMYEIENDLKAATALDPILVRYAELVSRDLPDEHVDLLYALSQSSATDRTPEAIEEAQTALRAFAADLEQAAKSVYGWEELAAVEVERALLRSMRRNLGERALRKSVAAARDKVSGDVIPSEKILACNAVVNNALEISRPDIASGWLEKAQEIAKLNPTAADDNMRQTLDGLEKAVHEQPLSALLLCL